MTQKERQELSREKILQAAAKEFGDRGYDAVTMDSICFGHGISKGMMYHYYSGKDELFLLCIGRMFQELRDFLDMQEQPVSSDPLEAVQDFFLMREKFFRIHPDYKKIFENAMLHPPKHLKEQILALRAPVRDMNLKFLHPAISRLPLRPDLSQEQVIRYFECVEAFFWNLTEQYQAGRPASDYRSLLAVSKEVLDMVLFGIAVKKS